MSQYRIFLNQVVSATVDVEAGSLTEAQAKAQDHAAQAGIAGCEFDGWWAMPGHYVDCEYVEGAAVAEPDDLDSRLQQVARALYDHWQRNVGYNAKVPWEKTTDHLRGVFQREAAIVRGVILGPQQ